MKASSCRELALFFNFSRSHSPAHLLPKLHSRKKQLRPVVELQGRTAAAAAAVATLRRRLLHIKALVKARVLVLRTLVPMMIVTKRRRQ